MTNLDSIFKSRDITLPTKVHLVKAMIFPLVMYGCESWTVKKAEHRRIDAFELWCWRRLLRVLWIARRSTVHSEGDQPWDFFGRNDTKAETPVFWPPHGKSWLIGKYSDSGRDWGQEEKGMTEDEMAGWHHWLNGHEFKWTLGVGDGQGGLVCCDSWGRKESDMTERLNWTELNWNLDKGLKLLILLQGPWWSPCLGVYQVGGHAPTSSNSAGWGGTAVVMGGGGTQCGLQDRELKPGLSIATVYQPITKSLPWPALDNNPLIDSTLH